MVSKEGQIGKHRNEISGGERQDRALIPYDNLLKRLTESGFKIVSSIFLENPDSTILDLCGVRLNIETDGEINQVKEWIEEDFFKMNFNNLPVLRIIDFRQDNCIKELGGRLIQPEYKVVHIICSRMTIDDKPEVGFMEIQLVTSKQDEINKSLTSDLLEDKVLH